jgi:dephospho-CoA kinase
MLKVGITGGIGSGKSTVCQVFSTLGIPVFSADDAAKYLMDNDAALISKIKGLLGADVYINGSLDRSKVSAIVFNEPAKLLQLNTLVHPATIQYGQQWAAEQASPYIIKEAAIFFESGSYKEMDIMMGVHAPIELRITRAMQRGNVTRQAILARIAQQMDEDEKMKRCDYVITNDDVMPVIPQVLSLHQELLLRTTAVRSEL